MPELPEVETVRRGLAPVLVGHALARVVARRPDLRFPLPDGFGQRLTGQTVTGLERRAKYLLFMLSGGEVLIAHLGMSGSFRIFETAPPPPAKHEHVEFITDASVSVRYHDPRRFGFMDLVAADQLSAHPMLRDLGPEPLDDAFDGERLAASLKGRRTPIKSALLDQRTVAGIGNIYACEALFRAGISPRRLAHSVQGTRARRLAGAIKQVLSEAIQAGGSTLNDHRRPDGELGYFQHQFQVYARAGRPCPGCTCGGAVQQIVQAGRSTFFCGARQR